MKGLSSLMGMTVVAFASAVPDTLQAINVARKGFGSMAVASALGSLIINVYLTCGDQGHRLVLVSVFPTSLLPAAMDWVTFLSVLSLNSTPISSICLLV